LHPLSLACVDVVKAPHREIERRSVNILFFDEIQIVTGWEKYINQLLREGYKIFITGSNASMLSTELGTHLTGRYLSMELFPFSYSEFIRFNPFKMERKL
jgi:predicted AAA+ superfamily ATPase